MSGGGGFTLVDFTIPTRDVPMSHPAAEAPLCSDCQSLDLCFFDPTCAGCQDILLDSKTTIPELFAVMRQWVPQTQRNMTSLSREVLRRGANVNDRDGLTDLTLLHYASKSGAAGVGKETSAANLVNSLISKGADTDMRCRWTNMNALHYAVFFDSSEVVEALAEHNPSLVMSVCSEFNDGNCLHIAAANLSLEAAKVAIKYGADASLKDRDGKLPHECVPDIVSKDQENTAIELSEILTNAAENPPPTPKQKYLQTPSKSLSFHSSTTNAQNVTDNANTHHVQPTLKTSLSNTAATLSTVDKSPAPSTISTTSTRHTESSTSESSRTHSPAVEEVIVTMATLGVKIGDRIIIDSASDRPKFGTIRYGGTTEFQTGQWAGIELDEAIGKNDGSYGGIRYFTCKTKFGLFVPMHRITKAQHQPKAKERHRKKLKLKTRDSLLITNKAIEAQGKLQMNTDLQVGERVMVSGSRTGVLRFAGAVKFAPGFWLGIELDNAHGKHNGSRDGVKYFQCKTNHGVFVPPSKVKRLSSLASLKTTSASSGTESTDFSSGSCSIANSGASGSSDALPSSPSPNTSPPSARKNTPSHRSTSSKASRPGTSGSSTGTVSPIPLSLASSPDLVLEVGMSVFANKELGVLRYIGATEFAPGIWLGVELRKPTGKNDGSVQGKRYFTCKPNCGRFVKPEKATHRGINCAKLVRKPDAQKT